MKTRKNHRSGCKVFQIVLRGGEIGNFVGVDFLLGGGKLRRSGFDHLNLFQSEKQLSVNNEYQLFYFLQWKPFKNDEKCFLFYLKSSFCSQDI